MPKYADIRRVGVGGFAEVWACACDDDGEMYAKKKLINADDAEVLKRFKREVRIISKLGHPNIVHILATRLNSPPYFYVMPLYDGSLESHLDEYLGNDGKIDALLEHLLTGLEYAHSQGVIHRDLNPRNILLSGSNPRSAVISDFGLGRDIDSESTRRTQTGFGMGTFLYMAPEQFSDAKNASAQSDIYSVGRIIYELFTEKLTSPHHDLQKLPARIAFVVDRCTQHKPDRRFASVGELKAAWRSVFDNRNSQSNLSRIKELSLTLGQGLNPDNASIDEFANLLAGLLDDEDLIHELLMSLGPDAFAVFVQRHHALANTVADAFCAFTAEQDWPFSYTDKIGDRLEQFFSATSDAPIRALLLHCTAVVGLRHNRFHVMHCFAEMIESLPPGPEASVFANRLEALSASDFERLRDYVKVGTLPIPLVRLFSGR